MKFKFYALLQANLRGGILMLGLTTCKPLLRKKIEEIRPTKVEEDKGRMG